MYIPFADVPKEQPDSEIRSSRLNAAALQPLTGFLSDCQQFVFCRSTHHIMRVKKAADRPSRASSSWGERSEKVMTASPVSESSTEEVPSKKPVASRNGRGSGKR